MNKSIVLGLVRHVLTAAGGALVGRGVIDDAGWSEAVGAIVTLIGVGWSMWEKQHLAVRPPAQGEGKNG